MPMNVSDLSSYPDFFAFGFSMVITAIVSIGAKESSFMNKIFTILNLSVILFVIVCGGIKSNLNNWKIPESQVSILELIVLKFG
jgi:amino acid transporter